MTNATTSQAASCLRDARARLPSLVEAVIDRAIRHLAFQSALSPDAQRSEDMRAAGALLYKARRPIERSFARELRRALAQEGAFPDSICGDAAALDICLDDGLAARLDLAHLCDAAELACTAERIEFEALYCGADGGHLVQGGNPLRPEVFARSLAAALDAWPVRRRMRETWFTHMGEPLGVELAPFYRALAKGLRNAGAREAQFIPPMVGGRVFESWRAAA